MLLAPRNVKHYQLPQSERLHSVVVYDFCRQMKQILDFISGRTDYGTHIQFQLFKNRLINIPVRIYQIPEKRILPYCLQMFVSYIQEMCSCQVQLYFIHGILFIDYPLRAFLQVSALYSPAPFCLLYFREGSPTWHNGNLPPDTAPPPNCRPNT